MAWLLGTATAAAGEAAGGFRVPDGFVVEEWAGDALAHDIFSMTIDARGRVVVSGRGYIKVLEDGDGDGAADRATLFADWPRMGARGLCFDGDDLLCSGDDGLYRIPDRDGDGVADGPGRLLSPSRNPGEHAANGVVIGPDGAIYWIAGNDAGIDASHAAAPGSALRAPRCGALVRLSRDGSTSEVLAEGFRNPYDLDFAPSGEVLTYDADGERDQYLPWYSPTRIFDIAVAGHHGWVLLGWQHAWNRPERFVDNVERLCEVGRGSPTGVAVYRHTAFPERWRGGLFAACWSLGRIYHVPLERRGSTFVRRAPEIFLETAGDAGFAPVDIAVGAAGELWVAIGGRGTRGGVFRVRPPSAPRPAPADALAAALDAPQPLASWSRARWAPAAGLLGAAAFLDAAIDARRAPAQRVRAIEILVDLFDGLPVAAARRCIEGGEPVVGARALWALGRGVALAGPAVDRAAALEALAGGTRSGDAVVARAAWEALLSCPPPIASERARPDWTRGLRHEDRRVRAAAAALARGAGAEDFARALPDLDRLEHPRDIIGWLLARGPAAEAPPAAIERRIAAAIAAYRRGDASDRLAAVRLVQIELGDVALEQDGARVGDGYVGARASTIDAAARARVAGALLEPLPSRDPDLDRERFRLLAMLATPSPAALDAIAAAFSASSSVEDDIHLLLAAAAIPGPRPPGFAARASAALLALGRKMRASGHEPSRFWPVRVAAAFDALRRRDGGMVAALLADPAFGRPDHAIFVDALDGEERDRAAGVLVERAGAAGEPWTTELVRLAGSMPDDAGLPALRQRFAEPALRDAIALALSARAREEDRGRLLAALESRSPEVVEACVRALRGLPERDPDPAELRAVLESLAGWLPVRDREALRRALAELLERLSGAGVAIGVSTDPRAAYRPWFAWFEERYPEAAAGLAALAAGLDATALAARLDAIDWSAGDAGRGRRVFEARGCQSCHAGSQRLGPDLAGVTARLSRHDLFVSIVDPGRDVSPAFAARMLVTRSGRVYTGMMIYESPAAMLVQVSAETTVRLTGDEVLEMRAAAGSFMPEGLLEGLSDADLADLHAYMAALRKK